MALYRRGRLWYADYYADGVRVQESTGTANKREAEKILALRVSEVQRGVFVKPVNITLPEFGERYIEYAKAHKHRCGSGNTSRRGSKMCARRRQTGNWLCSSICSTLRNDGDSTRGRIPSGW